MPVNAFQLSGRALFDNELIRRGLQPQTAKLLILRPADASMLRILCWRCYDALVRYRKLQELVKANVSDAVDNLLQANNRLFCDVESP